MRQRSKTIAVCSMTAALGVVVMLLGAVLELGMYLCPMLVGLGLIPAGRKFGQKYQLLLWIAISLLSFLLVPNPEENLIFFGLFGWYPALHPKLQRLPKFLRSMAKLLIFNTVVIAIEALIIYILVPELIEGSMLVLLLLLGNAMFILYDRVVERYDAIEANLKQKYFHC